MKNKYFILILLVTAAIISGCTKNQAPLQQNSSDQSVVSTPEKNNTDDWQVYKNENLGIELKYPLDWIVVPIENGQNITVGFREENLHPGDSNYSQIYIDSKDNPDKLSLEKYYDNLFKESNEVIPNYFDINDVMYSTIDGLDAVQFSMIPGAVSNTMTSIFADDKIIEISKHNEGNMEADEVYDLLIKSVKIKK